MGNRCWSSRQFLVLFWSIVYQTVLSLDDGFASVVPIRAHALLNCYEGNQHLHNLSEFPSVTVKQLAFPADLLG